MMIVICYYQKNSNGPELMNNKIIGLPAGTTVLRLLPPLVISYEDLDTVADKLVELLK